MITISGAVEAGEAQGSMRAIQARLFGSGFATIIYVASLFVGLATGIAAAVVANQIFEEPIFLWPIVLVALAGLSLLSTRLFQRWSVNRFRQNMQIRGMQTNVKCTFSITDDEIIQETEWMRKIASWRSVTDIVRSQQYWILMVGFEPWVIPSRFFSNIEDERNFIATCLVHLSADARARSQDASSFISS